MFNLLSLFIVSINVVASTSVFDNGDETKKINGMPETFDLKHHPSSYIDPSTLKLIHDEFIQNEELYHNTKYNLTKKYTIK